ncbi:MAG: carbon-nitrogen hydrolase family protein, partial [Saccharolobus sp.]
VGLQIWREFLKIRSLENRIAIVNSNSYNPPDFPGGSTVIVPEQSDSGIVIPRIVEELENEENYMIASIDPLNYIYLRDNRLKEIVKFRIKEI